MCCVGLGECSQGRLCSSGEAESPWETTEPGKSPLQTRLQSGLRFCLCLGCSPPASGLLVRAHRTEQSGPPFLFVGLLSVSMSLWDFKRATLEACREYGLRPG